MNCKDELVKELNKQYGEIIDVTETYDYIDGYDKFLSRLCDKAKETLYFSIVQSMPYAAIGIFGTEKKLSPIGQIFLIAYQTLSSNLKGFIRWNEKYGLKKTQECPLAEEMSNIYAQCDDEIDGKKYIIDFVIEFSPIFFNTGIRYAIELDGYDYHSSKEQMNHDYERERALQKEGYKVIRFTGSQIYKDPFGCAREVIEMVVADATEFVEYF